MTAWAGDATFAGAGAQSALVSRQNLAGYVSFSDISSLSAVFTHQAKETEVRFASDSSLSVATTQNQRISARFEGGSTLLGILGETQTIAAQFGGTAAVRVFADKVPLFALSDFGGTYSTGSITLSTDSALVTGTGTVWDSIAEAGDWIFVNGVMGLIGEVTDETHMVLALPWSGFSVTNGQYVLLKTSWLRYDPAITQAKLREFIADLRENGIFLATNLDPPDPGLGENGQFAIKMNDGSFTTWLKIDNVWTIQSPTYSAFELLDAHRVITIADRGKYFSLTEAHTMELPDAATLGGGFTFLVGNDGNDTWSLTPNTALQTVNGETTFPVAPGTRLRVVSDGISKYYTIPGGNTTGKYENVAALEAAMVDSTVEVVETQGYYTAGDGGGVKYKRYDSDPEHEMWQQSADGAYWVPMPDANGAISVLAAGAKGDETTDDHHNIQRLVDAHTYFTICDEVYFPSKIGGGAIALYRITSSIQCGYGYAGNGHGNFVTTHIRGGGGNAFVGPAALFCDWTDNRPAVVLHGQRYFTWYGVNLRGPLRDFIDSNSLSIEGCDIDDTDEDNWKDPGLSSACYSQTAPLAGFAIDPFCSDAGGPDTKYPDLGIPDFLGTGFEQYGNLFDGNRSPSSMMKIEESTIEGFTVGIVSHPAGGGGSDGNGDFIDIIRCQIGYCIYGLSICHTQSRSVNRISTACGICYCAETTSTHGNQNGKMAGVNVSANFGNCIYIFLFENDLSIAGPITYIEAYGEDDWALGTAGTGTGVANGLEMIGCNIGFNLQRPQDARGIPRLMLSATSATPVNYKFENCAFGVYSVFPMYVSISPAGTGPTGFGRNGNLVINGVTLGTFNDGVRPTLWERAAVNALAGGFVTNLNPQHNNVEHRIHGYRWSLDDAPDNSTADSQMYGPTAWSRRGRPVNIFSKYAVGVNTWESAAERIPGLFSLIDKGTLSSISLDQLELTLEYNQGAYGWMRWGPLEGDVLVDNDSGSVFFVNNVVGTGNTRTIHATLQNNFKPAVSGWTYHQTPDLGNGYMVVINARVYTPSNIIVGDITEGDNSVTNVAMPSGDDTHWDGDIEAGDWYCITEQAGPDDVAFIPGSDHSVGSFATGTFDVGDIARYDEKRHHFKFFIRPGVV